MFSIDVRALRDSRTPVQQFECGVNCDDLEWSSKKAALRVSLDRAVAKVGDFVQVKQSVSEGSVYWLGRVWETKLTGKTHDVIYTISFQND